MGKFSHKLAKALINSFLNAKKYARLDESLSGHDSKRQTPARLPVLKIAMFNWQKQMQKKLCYHRHNTPGNGSIFSASSIQGYPNAKMVDKR